MATDNGFFLVLEVDLSLFNWINRAGFETVQGFLSVSFLVRLKLCPLKISKNFFLLLFKNTPAK